MISVIVATLNSAVSLQTLLPPLVPAAVDGLVREVIAADGGSTDATLEICEDAGVKVVTGGLLAATAAARSGRVLILPEGLAFSGDWQDRLRAHLISGGGSALVAGARASGLLARLQPQALGLLIDRARLAEGGDTRDVAELVRRHRRGAKRI